jgi:hypothetical protein
MIRKSLLLFALPLLISSSVFATVTSHKEWSAPHIKLTLSPSTNNPAIYNAYLRKAKADKTATQWLQTTSRITDVQFDKEENTVTATADNGYFLGNFTSSQQIYTVTQSACSMKKEGEVYKDDRCANSSSTYGIASQNVEFSSGKASMRWTDVNPGDYMISFGTQVQNSEGDTVFSTYDYKFITVPAKA